MITMTDAQAAAAMRAHHSEMRDQLGRRVNELLATVSRGFDPAQSLGTVLEYLDTEVLPHAAAEEKALYPAGDAGRSALLVKAMRAEHVNLIEHVAYLRFASSAVDAVALSSAILALFESHLHKENELLIPSLVADPDVSLSVLLGGMHELLG